MTITYKHSFTDRDNETHTRNSVRQYTHAAVTKFNDDVQEAWRGRKQVNWAGSEKLAQKIADRNSKYDYVHSAYTMPVEIEAE